MPMQFDRNLNLYTLRIKKQVKKKLSFKFIVNDADYVTAPLYETERDDLGNENNILELSKIGSKVIH